MKLKQKSLGVLTAALCAVNVFAGVCSSMICEASADSVVVRYNEYMYYKKVDESY